MLRADRYFVATLLLTGALVIAAGAWNVHTVLYPPPSFKKIDVARVKEAIARSGLTPSEAKYWKLILKQ